ncbi:dephospho-CoA kinase [Priestia megaterium]|uniref:GrpB family protein n=1 Tax=Priestia megaterium TaxID=1404 RepID=UPI000BFA1F28|nr:GrpB family protein [Priestia megaterium]PFK63485.1 dephospho-CoA kinase [Priestia megaterium]
MNLGLKKDEVRLVDYTPEWNEEFIRVKKEIMANTPLKENQIEHIGSTAIKGMSAKPILDILVGVNDLQNFNRTIISGLKKVGFLQLRVEIPGKVVFAKFTDKTHQEKTHYIHLVEFQKELWNNLIFFRDYLNSNETAREQYLEVKLEYLKKTSTGINEYTHYKQEFVTNILKKRSN